jgi:transcriptional regulator with XRE-family HTH domain
MLGDRIRKIRKQKKMTIKGMAEAAGVTSSLVSQIEKNKANPSINSLMAIAKVLQVPMASFFEEDLAIAEPVVRPETRKCLRTRNGVTYYLLTPDIQSHRLGFIFNIFEKGASAGEMYSHEGEECGYVLEGRLEVTYNGATYILEAGDSIILDSTIPHMCKNIYNGQTIAIWANSPPSW